MAYRAPRYSYHNAFNRLGGNYITHYGVAHESYPITNLYNNRNSSVFSFSDVYTDPWIQLDLGGAFESGYNRLIIPENHDIATLKVEQADDEAFTTNVETLHSTDTTPTANTIYDSGEFDTQASDRRFVRVTFVGTSFYYLPALFLTKLITLDVGPTLANSLDTYIANTTRIVQPSGVSLAVQHGPHQRRLDYEYEFPLSGTDLTSVEAMVAFVGMHLPFYVDPASFSATPGADDPPLYVKFAEMPETKLGVMVPMQATEAKTVTLSMIECVD